jgi:hypothetical protein
MEPHHVLWRGNFGERRKKPVRLVPEVGEKITVKFIIPSRDAKTGRVAYTTFDSLDVTDAKPEEVFSVCKEAILRSANAVKK